MSTKEVVMTEEWNESDDFKRVGTEGLSGEDIGQKSLTYWADVWRRFRENKLAIFGLILLQQKQRDVQRRELYGNMF